MGADSTLLMAAILGAGGFAREVQDIFRDLGESSYCLLGFVDRDESRQGEMVNGAEILGSARNAVDRGAVFAVLGSGETNIRVRQIEEIESSGLRPLTLVHPSVIMSAFVTMGEGCVVTAGVILTNNIVLSDYVMINLGCTVGHDVTIGRNAVLAPGAHISGFCAIGSDCYIGTGAVLLPHVTVGDGAIVGAGAVVTKDVPPSTTVVGMPAKPIRTAT